MSASDPFQSLSRVIHSRRTHKRFDGRSVSDGVIRELLELAIWAPNHRLSEPWRFCVLDQAAIQRLGGFLLSTPAISSVPDPAKGKAKLAALLERLPQAGAMILVTWLRAADAVVDQEDHAATAAAIEHILLGATAQGLGSYWSTTHALCHPATLAWCGTPASEGCLGWIWLGHPSAEPPVPPRSHGLSRARWLVPAS